MLSPATLDSSGLGGRSTAPLLMRNQRLGATARSRFSKQRELRIRWRPQNATIGSLPLVVAPLPVCDEKQPTRGLDRPCWWYLLLRFNNQSPIFSCSYVSRT